jgi:hypothetical protein
VEKNMSILVEAITVIFRNSTAESLIEGGFATIRENSPNRTFRTDGILSAVGFMTPEDTRCFVDQLKRVGFRFVEHGKSADIAICDQYRGFTTECEWLGTDVDGRGVRICWLLGHKPGDMATQEGWSFKKSLYTTGNFWADDEPVDHLNFLRTDDGLNVYLDEHTGKEVYAGRPFENKDDVHTIRTKSLLFASAVKVVYDAMAADGWMSINVKTEANALPHMIMRYRNQIGVVVLDVNWNGEPLSDFSSTTQNILVAKADEMKAIPLVASLDIIGKPNRPMSRVAEVEACNAVQFHLRRPYVVHDLSTGQEWSALCYDFESEIELSDWEIHDFGIQVVRQTLEKDGHQIQQWDSDVDATVQIVVSIGGNLTYVVVQTVRYPTVEPDFDRDQIRLAGERAARNGADMKIASVSLASTDDPFDPGGSFVQPIFRGAAVVPRFTGLADPVVAADG